MKIKVKRSDVMSIRANLGHVSEYRTIRVPTEILRNMALTIGRHLNVRTKDNSVISLYIENTLDQDSQNDKDCVFVTNEIYNSIYLENQECQVSLINGITLGCDPELILIDRNSLDIAKANCIFNKYGMIGSDGWLLELRPLPSTSDEMVVANLKSLIKNAAEKISCSKLYRNESLMIAAASAYKGLTAGFHLHFGLPKELLNKNVAYLIPGMLRVLDYYVGIPSIIPEGEIDTYRRTTPYVSYGKPSTFRIDNRTLEYKVPGGTLMRHPKLARGIISLGAAVMEDLVSRIKYCTDDFKDMNGKDRIAELYPNIPSGMDLINIICNANIGPAIKHMESVMKDVKSMVSFNSRSCGISTFFKILENGTNFSPDAEKNW